MNKKIYSSHKTNTFTKNQQIYRKHDDQFFIKQLKENKPKTQARNLKDSKQKEYKCSICDKITDRCCGLCGKVYYCCEEHQATDWFMKHKYSCEGAQNTSNSEMEQAVGEETHKNFAFYTKKSDKKGKSRNKSIDSDAKGHSKSPVGKNTIQKLHQIQQEESNFQSFLELIENRLVIRDRLLQNVDKSSKERGIEIIRETLVKQAKQLIEISYEITKNQFKPSYSKKKISVCEDEDGKIIAYHTQFSSQNLAQAGSIELYERPVTINQVGLLVQYLGDQNLAATVFHNAGLRKEARELLISMGNFMKNSQEQNIFLKTPEIDLEYESKLALSRTKTSQTLLTEKVMILQAIIRLSELYSIDSTTEVMNSLFIKLIEKYQGQKQKIYAYFNMGVWYAKRTYYEKSVKAFLYCLAMLNSKKKNGREVIVFMADVQYNIGIAYWAMNDHGLAIENMQESYQNRVNGIGKNSIEASECLQKLAKWYKKLERWEECIQYLEECHRIRKQHQESQMELQSLNLIKQQIKQVYIRIRGEKQKIQGSISNYRNFSMLIENENREKEEEVSQKQMQFKEETVTKRLFSPQYIDFKINITKEMFQEYSYKQIEELNLLFEKTDQKMTPEEAIRFVTQNDLYESLSENQRENFIKYNAHIFK